MSTRETCCTFATACAVCVFIPSLAFAQNTARPSVGANLLRDFNASVEELSTRVSTSVVQVLVTGYGRVDERPRDGQTGLVIGRQRSIGSGAIIDAEGYIITNAHVVAGAKHIQVVLRRDTTAPGTAHSFAEEASQTIDARIVGIAGDIDLALLKVDAAGLQPLRFANYDTVRQGDLVFAFGSPEGLRNSVSMGVVSSVARQPDPDSPSIFIQTDAPINPGNSGGPLVNVDGELVGVNTFILTESGGSQGLGFAIPSTIVKAAYPQLRKYGHLHRGLIGFSMQAITPALANALDLARTTGVMVSDVVPDSAADAGGIAVKDVITTVNGKSIESVPMLALELGRYGADDVVTLGLLRGTDVVTAMVTVRERPHAVDELAGLADPEKNAVPRLGIVGVDIGDATTELLPVLRIRSGVFVAARTQVSSGSEVPLVAGDVIHAVGNYAVRSVDGLRTLIDGARADGELVLQIEREGRLQFVVCQIF